VQHHAFDNSTVAMWEGDDEAWALSPTRSARDERAIQVVCHLLMAGLALERRVGALVRGRSTS
jgi:hypothetical protein